MHTNFLSLASSSLLGRLGGAPNVDLAEMNKLLLQKIEEITMYLIEKDKKIENLEEAKRMEQGEREELESKVETMSERLEKLESLIAK